MKTEIEANLEFLRQRCAFLSDMIHMIQNVRRDSIRFGIDQLYLSSLETHVSEKLLVAITELDIMEAEVEAYHEVMQRFSDGIH